MTGASTRGGVLACTTLAGFAMDDMMRDAGWRFLMIGRRIERLQFLSLAAAGILERYDGTMAPIECLLELSESSDAFRTRYQRPPELLPAVDLVVLDEANPHGILPQAELLERYLDRLGRDLPVPPSARLADAITAVRAVDLSPLEALPDADGVLTAAARAVDLAGRLRNLSAMAGELSDQLVRAHFSHVGTLGQRTVTA